MSATEEESELSLLVGYEEGEPYLIGGRCSTCEAICFPKPSICPRCTGQSIAKVLLSRRGRLHTYTEVFQKPPDYEGVVPYFIGRVLLPEGVFVLTQLKAEKEDLKIGREMELIVEAIFCNESGKQFVGYKFKPAGNSNQ